MVMHGVMGFTILSSVLEPIKGNGENKREMYASRRPVGFVRALVLFS
jgi:hypothetical protein